MGFGDFVKRGAGFMADPFGGGAAFTEAFTGGPPEKSFLGGSQEALDAQRAGLGGLGRTNADLGQRTLKQAAGLARSDRAAGYDMLRQGNVLGQQGVGQQNAALGAMLGQAQQRGPSAAQAQLQQGLGQVQQSMLGQAAQARGGNQAAAIRQAQMSGAQMAQQTNQQAAILRAQEEAQRQQQILGAQAAAAGMYGQQAGLGYGMAGQGLGAVQQSTGQLGAFGGQLGQQGLAAYGLLNQANMAQLEADRGNASAAAAARNPGSAFGGIFSGILGM